MAVVLIPAANGTIVTDGSWLQTSAAFDGTTNQSGAASAQAASNGISTNGTVYYIGKDWGAGITHTVSQIIVYGPNNNSILGGGSTVGSWTFDGSSNGSSWTTLDSGSTPGTTSEVITRTSATMNVSTAYRYHRFTVTGNGANGISIAEVQFYENPSTPSQNRRIRAVYLRR